MSAKDAFSGLQLRHCVILASQTCLYLDHNNLFGYIRSKHLHCYYFPALINFHWFKSIPEKWQNQSHQERGRKVKYIMVTMKLMEMLKRYQKRIFIVYIDYIKIVFRLNWIQNVSSVKASLWHLILVAPWRASCHPPTATCKFWQSCSRRRIFRMN